MRFPLIKDSFSKTPIWFQWGWLLVFAGFICLRFLFIDDRAWGYDELSAIFRAMKATNWNEHLRQGVAVDGHPAGLQTILWLWVRTFGTDVLPLRIATALFSLATLWQIHTMVKHHFGHEAAFWSVAMMGLMWWQVSMGLWIRPYIFGLPFVLWAWDLVLRATKKNQEYQQKNESKNEPSTQENLPISMGWFSLQLGGALAGAAYIHFFAGLTAGASFMIFLLSPPKIAQSKSDNTQGIHPSFILFLPLTIAFLFYIPHLPLLFAQLQLSGLQWLNKPTPDFIFHFFQYASGDSTPILIILMASIIYALQFDFRTAYLPKPASLKRVFNQPSIKLITGIIIVFSVGYTYSLLKAPVLQNNALYFAFPLVIIVASHGISTLRSQLKQNISQINSLYKYSQILAILLPAYLIYNTVVEKSWFNLEVQGCHHRIIEQAQIQYNQRNNPNYPLQIWLDGPADNYQFHIQQLAPKSKTEQPLQASNIKFFESHGPSLNFIHEQLTSLKPTQTVFFASQSGSQPWLLPLIEAHFEKSTRTKNDTQTTANQSEMLIGGEWMILSEPRNPKITAKDFNLLYSETIFNTADTISIHKTISIKSLLLKPNDVIIILVDTAKCYGEIQTSLWNKGNQIDWRSTQVADFTNAKFAFAIHAIKLADIPHWNKQTDLKIHFDACSQFVLGVYHGNPYLYGIH